MQRFGSLHPWWLAPSRRRCQPPGQELRSGTSLGRKTGRPIQKKKSPPQRAVSRILFHASAPGIRPELRRGNDHSSSPVIADGIKRPTRRLRTGSPGNASLFGLAPCGVLPATRVTTSAVRSYRTFSPLPTFALWATAGGMFSVPLSFELPRPGVTRHTALRSSDFPLAFAPFGREGGRSSGLLRRATNFSAVAFLGDSVLLEFLV